MLERLSATCEGCDAALTDRGLRLSMCTDAGRRRAYECECGAVTITVVADDATDPKPPGGDR